MTNLPWRSTPDLPGYELNRLIGLGGMGEVHLARQVALNRPVAVKFLTRTPGDPLEEYEARFRREAELMARISHPNVVTIYDFGAVDGRAYLVMEYIEGGDLRSRMIPDLPMPIPQIRSILGPVIKAMEYLHSQGIVHRDMKPENILMQREETPKVTDFGIAVLDFAAGSLTRTGRALGTPGYVAPEQQYGLKVDARADQFSLAALCYEMATGRKPLGAFPAPQKLNPKLGPEAGAVILRALSEDPTDRYATIGEFGGALDRALGAVEGPESSRRPGWLAASIGSIAALAILGGAAAYFLPRPAPAPIAVQPGPIVPDAGKIPEGTGEPADRWTVRSIDLTLVKVPAGEFWMGSPSGLPDAQPNESPRHLVRISRPYYLAEKEVTVGQFRKFIAEARHRTGAESPGKPGQPWGGWVFNLKENRQEQRPEVNWKAPGGPRPQFDDEPVVQVSWYDAVAFCDWLSRTEGRPFRLPTEAEWERACRAGSPGRWCFGDDPAQLDDYAWNLKNADHVLHPVGLKKKNAFGLFDMHGNVWEWCLDEFGPYGEAPVIDPKGPPEKQARALRGGSIDWEKVERTGAASRQPYPPYMSYYNYGFRVCSPIP